MVDNQYDDDTTLDNIAGLLMDATGEVTFRTDDGFGNKTTGTNSTTYNAAILALTGQAKVEKTINDSSTINR